MNAEQLRAEFEAWYMREFEVYPRRNESGGFRSQYVNAMFKSWKGGRAALQSQDREDAERYRRLRKGDIDDVAVVQGLGAMDYGASAVIATYSYEIDGDDLDAAIDHARRIEGDGE